MSSQPRTPYRILRRLLRDPGFFQACAYGFAAVLAAVTLTVGPVLWGAAR